jgi:hypothetical protein
VRGLRFTSGIAVFAALFATISTPSLAQNSSVMTTRLDGPASAAQGSGGAAGLGSAVLDRAAACGMDADALTVMQERALAEPTTEAEEAALDAQIEAISAEAGFTGPKADRQVSRNAIRAMLTQRLNLTLTYTAANAEAGMACLVEGLAEAGFAPVGKPSAFTQKDADAILDACGAERGWLTVHPSGEVRFEPPMEADYKVSACILQRIKDGGVTKFGFVGNEKAPAE